MKESTGPGYELQGSRNMAGLPRRGMILGKFWPPTEGHRYLAEFGRRLCGRLSVLVCTLPSEPIPGVCRFTWVREMLPGCDVVHVPDDLPAAPEDSPDFWPLWLGVVQRVVPEPVDVVFTSEGYGGELAARLGARHLVCDRRREAEPVSGTDVRDNPFAHWKYLPEVVRPWYCRRVVCFGPESTGKSTLAARLAARFDTAWVPEWARAHLDPKGGKCAPEDIPLIAAGQAASEDALARRSNRLLVCDTDPLLTTIWSEVYFGSCPAEVRRLADERACDLYLLCGVDAPWVDDGQRDLAHRREEFFDRCRQVLESRGRPHVHLTGDWDTRFRVASAAIEPLLGPLSGTPPIAAQPRLAREIGNAYRPGGL